MYGIPCRHTLPYRNLLLTVCRIAFAINGGVLSGARRYALRPVAGHVTLIDPGGHILMLVGYMRVSSDSDRQSTDSR